MARRHLWFSFSLLITPCGHSLPQRLCLSRLRMLGNVVRIRVETLAKSSAIRDTRVLLTAVDEGRVTPMTENHHADTRIEATRLRRSMGSGLILDSFGEARYDLLQLGCLDCADSATFCRWMGALENTRRYDIFPPTIVPYSSLSQIQPWRLEIQAVWRNSRTGSSFQITPWLVHHTFVPK